MRRAHVPPGMQRYSVDPADALEPAPAHTGQTARAHAVEASVAMEPTRYTMSLEPVSRSMSRPSPVNASPLVATETASPSHLVAAASGSTARHSYPSGSHGLRCDRTVENVVGRPLSLTVGLMD